MSDCTNCETTEWCSWHGCVAVDEVSARMLAKAEERERHAKEVFSANGLDPERVRDVFASSTTSENHELND